jgi:flagellar biosynthesis chaperone FliJ
MSKAHKSKRFNYHLKDVLKVRTIRERQEQDTFREAEKKLAREQQKEKELIETQENFYSELLSCISSDKTTDMDDIKRRKAHLELKEQVDAQIEVRKKAEKDRDTQRQVLTEAIKKKKVIEKDQEKTKGAWKKIMNKEDGKFLDEMAVLGFDRKKRKTTD